MARCDESEPRWTLGPGALVRLAHRLGRQAASGVLTLGDPAGDRPDVLVHELRRGTVVFSGQAGELARRGPSPSE